MDSDEDTMGLGSDTNLFSYASRYYDQTCNTSSDCNGSLLCCTTGYYYTSYSYLTYVYGYYSYSYWTYNYSYGIQPTCDYNSGCIVNTPSHFNPWVIIGPVMAFSLILFIIIVIACRRRRARMDNIRLVKQHAQAQQTTTIVHAQQQALPPNMQGFGQYAPPVQHY